MRNVIAFLILGGFCLLPARAAEPQTAEAQLRERLRAAMLQLRTAETERASLQAAQAQSAEEKKALTERVDLLTKEANAGKLAAQAVQDLKAQVAQQEKEMARLKETIESCRQAAEVARAKEAERAKAAEEAVAGLERLVGDRQEKNLALYKVAMDILQRYEKFGLGDALAAREPFTRLTRVKLENLVQDYRDKILSERTTLAEKELVTNRDKLLK